MHVGLSLSVLLAATALVGCSQRSQSQPAPTASMAQTSLPPSDMPPPSATIPRPPTPEELGALAVAPIGVPDVPGVVEITNTDITTIPDYDALRGSFFGVRLGMSPEEAERTIATLKSLRIDFDPDAEEDGFGKRASLYETAASRGALAELSWPKEKSGLDQIHLLPAAVIHLKGKTARLFSTSAISADSELSMFLGKPGTKKSESEKDVSTELFPFPARHMAIEDAHLRHMRQITPIFAR